jgi:hypothetical protein
MILVASIKNRLNIAINIQTIIINWQISNNFDELAIGLLYNRI